MRTYRAARRQSTKDPVEFDFAYDLRQEKRDEKTGELIGIEYVETVEHFVCEGEVSTLLLSELAYNADLDVADPEAMKLIRNFFAQAFGDTEEGRKGYVRFFRLQTQYGDDELLMEIMAGMVEDFTGRPTKQPSGSLSTPSTTGAQSKVVSLSRGTVEFVPGELLSSEENPEEESDQEASSG